MYIFKSVLCMLFTTSAIALPKDIENATSNESQPASVQEVPQPPMTVQDASLKVASPQEYVLPGYYTFNKGEPFYVEKDPLTGAIDFNRKTTPKSAEKDEPESDYFYDDQYTEDGIDRKDGSLEGPSNYRPNDIFHSPYKISPDLHQFLNLPVHYSSSDKFPLISSSYANTKIQGTAGSSSTYSNHKYVTTSSTQSPSYYTMPTTKYTTMKPAYSSTTARTTTGYPVTKSTTTTEAEEYDNTDYSEYEEEDSNTAQDNQAVASQPQTYTPDTTRYTVTTYRPTTYKFTTPTAKTSSAQPITEKPKQQVSIVTSLPLDVYYSSSQESSTTPAPLTTTTTTVNSTTVTDSPHKPAQTSTETQTYNKNPSYNIPNEGVYTGFGEQPFRPIYGLPDSSIKVEGSTQTQYNKNEIYQQQPPNEFHRLPPHQHIPYLQRQPMPTIKPDMEPPRPDAPLTYYPDQPIKLLPGQQASISFGEAPKISSVSRPAQENVYERPPPAFNQEPHSPVKYESQDPTSSQKRPDNNPVFEGRPSEKPVPNGKPRPVQEYPIKSNFKMPSKVENHFIKVSPDQENPSYSLQTSFSIGVPGPSVNKDQPEVRPGQGVGQVLFPDNTPAENVPADTSSGNSNLPSPVLRPPGNRVPIQAYQPNRPGYRQPINIPSKPPLPYRVPNDDLQPPSGQADNYPRPHWENHGKPYYGPTQNAIPKKDVVLPQSYPGLSRGKPDKIQRPDLPNILPQFRPNAKLGSVDYYQPFSANGERPREPLDTLQPPPLPQPLHLRINRNDDELEIDREGTTGEIVQEPLVHRRSGPQPQLSRVTTLQMMQQNPPRKPGVRSEVTLENRQSSEKDKPVFLVYPSAHGMSHKSPPEEVVVIGTRAQRPLPPANLPEKDDLDTFPLDDNKQFPIPGRDRVDTPILKTKPAKPPIKNDFPYAILKPNSNDIPEERILSGSDKKEYTEYSPTPASSTEINRDQDSEINLIPYLQDYMPFATKKPQIVVKPTTNTKKDTKIQPKPPQVISTTLNASLATTTTTEKPSFEKETEKTEQEQNGSEMTLSATIYTQPRPSNHKIPITYTPSEPQPLGFQAPFLASLSAPESQGWSVVTDKNLKPATETPAENKADENDDGKFDIENFKPQLFGGFKPIMLSSDEDSVSAVGAGNKDKVVLLNKGDREERKL